MNSIKKTINYNNNYLTQSRFFVKYNFWSQKETGHRFRVQYVTLLTYRLGLTIYLSSTTATKKLRGLLAMKIKICQTNPLLLDLQANLEMVTSKIREGQKQGAELVVFPELSLTGYFVGDRYHEVALRLDSPEIKKLAAATKGTAAPTTPAAPTTEVEPTRNRLRPVLVLSSVTVLFSLRTR